MQCSVTHSHSPSAAGAGAGAGAVPCGHLAPRVVVAYKDGTGLRNLAGKATAKEGLQRKRK